jgi:hypothetical protein
MIPYALSVLSVYNKTEDAHEAKKTSLMRLEKAYGDEVVSRRRGKPLT